MSDRPTRRDELVQTIESDGETILYDADGRRLLVLNDVAAGVWTLLDGEHTVEQITDLIVETLSADRAQVHADVEAFLGQLDEHALLDRR